MAAAYAPREWPSRAGTGSTYPTDWRRWGFYKVDKQVDEDIDRLEDIDIVVLLVSHRQFKRMPRQWLREKAVIDVCGMFAQLNID